MPDLFVIFLRSLQLILQAEDDIFGHKFEYNAVQSAVERYFMYISMWQYVKLSEDLDVKSVCVYCF